jgi:cellulose synthase/poly-beta-1,6-N-acetylglucosamine synthase-like glycosyltransferase
LSASSLTSNLAELAAIGTWALVLAAYLLAQALVLLYAAHRVLTLWRCRRAQAVPPPALDSLAPVPMVTVQLPVFNERRVVERLIDAVARLRYPEGRLEIQVLDDSTDETLALARRAVARHRANAVDIHLLHRARRDGFKAGALHDGLSRARGEFLVVFDADFVPDPDFLERVLPHFADPKVGMVQARWGHLNRERSALTRAQAVLLDAHFLLEHQARMSCGLFFNFNGTAGAWRRSCIEDAGGWQHDTLTEDLDLSYRAQLHGWRFVFDPAIEARAELPADFAAFRSQQRRWVRGSIQTARKLLPRVFASALPRSVRIEALVHLTANLGYPLALALATLTLPLLLMPRPSGLGALAVLEGVVILCGVAPIVAGLIVAQRLQRRSAGESARDVLAALVLAAGLSVHNTRAVLEGFGARLGDWERTPKTGDGWSKSAAPPYAGPPRRSGRTELVLATYFVASLVLAAGYHQPRALPFMALFALGLGWVGVGSLRASPPRSVA